MAADKKLQIPALVSCSVRNQKIEHINAKASFINGSNTR